MREHIDLAEYLFTRLYQLGVRAVHGVPGDYNLLALDYVEPAGLTWVGNANELNAGYAADGYARIRGLAALVTAFGVGELSAINAIGASYSERASVVHIVGTPPTTAQQSGLCLHHSLGDGNFRVFADMYAKLTCAQANLTNAASAPNMIDYTLKECILQSRPVYIELPTNMTKVQVPAAQLSKPIDLTIPDNDEGFEDEEVEIILSKLYSAKQPLIIVDGFTKRYGISEEADELVRRTGFPTSTTPFGKSIVNESYHNFHGIYAGQAGKHMYVPWTQSCDLVLRLGPLDSDVNTYGFTTLPDPKVTITFNQHSVEIGGVDQSEHYGNLHVKPLLRKILDRMDASRLPKLNPYPSFLGDMRKQLAELPPTLEDDIIDQDTFWQRISTFFRPGDIVMTETGTPSSGGRDFVLPASTTLLNSSIWLSIGYMLGACAGAALAQREMMAEGSRPKGRTILFEGDGSLQMSAQAISDMIRNRLDVTIFIINNDGYTIERYIHGMTAGYNDIQPWRYLEAPSYYGAPENDPEYPVFTRRVYSWGQLNRVVEDVTFQKGKGLQLVEVIMLREDAPYTLKQLVALTGRRNSGEGTKTTSRQREETQKVHDDKVMKAAA